MDLKKDYMGYSYSVFYVNFYIGFNYEKLGEMRLVFISVSSLVLKYKMFLSKWNKIGIEIPNPNALSSHLY